MNSPTNPVAKTEHRKSPWLAALLSLLLPGLGPIYCRQDNKGVFLIGMSLLGQWSTGGLSSWFLCPAMALDAFLLARKLNTGKVIERWEFFPGIKPLNSIPSRIMLLAVVIVVAVLTVVHIRLFASGYDPANK